MTDIRTCSVEGCERIVQARGLCHNHYVQWWRKQNLEKVRESEHRRSLVRREERREQDRKRYLAHREEQLKHSREWKLAHPEKVREHKHNFYQTHQKELQERGRNYYLAHREKLLEQKSNYYLAHYEELSEYNREWNQANPEKRRAIAARRRARKTNTFDTLTLEEATTILAHGCFFGDLGDCEGPLSLAHDVPVSKGGNTTIANVLCLCRRHNSMMGTKALPDILSQLPLSLEVA